MSIYSQSSCVLIDCVSKVNAVAQTSVMSRRPSSSVKCDFLRILPRAKQYQFRGEVVNYTLYHISRPPFSKVWILIILLSLTISHSDPLGVKISKCYMYSSYSVDSFSTKPFFLNVLTGSLHKPRLLEFRNFKLIFFCKDWNWTLWTVGNEKLPMSWKWLTAERIWVTFGLGVPVERLWGTLNLRRSRSFWVHSVYFSLSDL